MNTLTDLIDRYIATWNEDRRRPSSRSHCADLDRGRQLSRSDAARRGQGRHRRDDRRCAGALPGPSLPPHRRCRKPPRPRALHLGACPRSRRSGGERYRFRYRRVGQPAAGDHRLLRPRPRATEADEAAAPTRGLLRQPDPNATTPRAARSAISSARVAVLAQDRLGVLAQSRRGRRDCCRRRTAARRSPAASAEPSAHADDAARRSRRMPATCGCSRKPV